jgi:hypothetical protein
LHIRYYIYAIHNFPIAAIGSITITCHKDLKLKRDPLPRGSLQKMLQQGAGSSDEPLRGPVATSEPAVEISAKGKGSKPARTSLGSILFGTK